MSPLFAAQGTTTVDAGKRDPPARRFALFGFLLGAAVVFHQQQLDDWAIPSFGLLVSLAAVWLMLRPGSLARLYLLVAVDLVSTVLDLPVVVNHWLLLFLAEIGIVVAVAGGLVRRAEWVRDPGAFYTRLAPYLRVQVLLVYLLAGFSKLNSDFLDSSLSCGVAMLDDVLTKGPLDLRAGWLHGPAIGAAIGIEFVLAFGLAFRRSRLAALFAGIAFHTVLAVVGHVPFSGFAMAFYALFAPDDLLLRADDVVSRHAVLRTVIGQARAVSRTFAGKAGALLSVGVLAVAIDIGGLGGVRGRAFLLLFLLYVAVLVALLVLCLRVRGAPSYLHGPLRLASPVWILGPLLVIANGVSPYLGAKTQSTFTMYSNLQTEGPRWNHLVVPEAVQILDRQDHLVRIIDSTDRAMREAARTGRLWVWDGLRSWARRHPDASLVYEDAGRRHTVTRVGDDARLRMNAVHAKFAHYRDVPAPGQNECRTTRDRSPDQHS